MFVDTSGLLCLIDERQAHHAEAVPLYDAATHRLTHSGVLVEFVALAQARRFPRQRAVAFIEALLQDEDIEIEWADEELHRRAVDVLVARPDKDYSLCDAISFVLMKRRAETEALTTDRHFEQEGFRRLLAGGK